MNNQDCEKENKNSDGKKNGNIKRPRNLCENDMTKTKTAGGQSLAKIVLVIFN